MHVTSIFNSKIKEDFFRGILGFWSLFSKQHVLLNFGESELKPILQILSIQTDVSNFISDNFSDKLLDKKSIVNITSLWLDHKC